MIPNELDAYATSVESGAIPAGKFHRLACVRHRLDREREGTPEFPFRFDHDRAERLFRFAERLKHYKGQWANTPIHLEPWQKFILGSVIGWVHTGTGLRRFRTAFHQIPRKNGKSLLAAVVLLYVAFFDGEPGAEGYCIGMKRDQAKLVFNDARKLVLSSGLKTRIKAFVANLSREDTSSKAQPLGADHDSTDGLNPNVVIVDEMHAMKDRGLLDVMETATGARRQPLIYIITTFGHEPVSPWGDQNDYANKILEGVLVDESFFVFTASADPEDDWQSPETARKANPNYGVSVNPDDLASKVLKAKGIPSAGATYKQKHLNLLTSSVNPCLSVDGWRAGQTSWTADDMSGESCYVGVDLASQLDLCALSLVFPPTSYRTAWRWLQFIWTPEDTLKDRAHRDRAPYDVWRDQGWLITTPGTSLDHDVVRQQLLKLRDQFQIIQIGFDPWHADAPIKNLTNQDGFSEEQVIAVPQTYAGMSAACLTVQAAILGGLVDSRRCPVTTWSVSNVNANHDGKDNLMFAKGKSRGRIDPVIAGTIGVSLAIRRAAAPASVYMQRGVRELGQ